MALKFYNTNELPYPDDWPPQEYYVAPETIAAATQVAFHELLDKEKVSETQVDNFIRQNPAILGQCLSFTSFGHHGTWVAPQKLMDPGAGLQRRGLKPDYVFGGKNSDGFFWCVAELKGPNDKLFKRGSNGALSFSAVANQGICQLLSYIDYCSAAQSFIRDHFHLNNFREPRGLLILGREAEFERDKQMQNLKAAWNRISADKIMIRSFDALLRGGEYCSSME